MPDTMRSWAKSLGVGVVALASMAAVTALSPAQARVIFDLGLPTYVAPPPYYAYARPASFSPSPSFAGAISVGFGNGRHWQ